MTSPVMLQLVAGETQLEMVTEYMSFGKGKLNKRGNHLAATKKLLAATFLGNSTRPFWILSIVGSGEIRRAKMSSHVSQRIDTNNDDISPLKALSLLLSAGKNPIRWIMFRTKGRVRIESGVSPTDLRGTH